MVEISSKMAKASLIVKQVIHEHPRGVELVKQPRQRHLV